MRVLILSHEVWSETNNGGNVLSNIFSDLDAEFAQIYCSPGAPNNKLCKKYFQITDSMILNGVFKGEKVGKEYNYKEVPYHQQENLKNDKEAKKWYFDIFKKYRFSLFTLFREFLWKIAPWKSPELEKFISDFNPDVIFAPCYSHLFMLRLDRYVKKVTRVKMLSYISDDSYSLRQFSLSPFYWINRFLSRGCIKKTFKDYSLVYTMTDEQANELSKSLDTQIKILRKGADFYGESKKTAVNDPIRIVYAGGIYINRWKILSEIGNALRKVNEEKIKIRLDIYTQNAVSKKQRALLHDGTSTFLHSAVSQKELIGIYEASDIALHVESFELKYRLLTRLSFSTKIVDCLLSNCAVMAIAWKEHAGMKYLKNNDAAICVDHISDLYDVLKKIAENPELITQYAAKAWSCGQKNHQIKQISKDLYYDFNKYSR